MQKAQRRISADDLWELWPSIRDGERVEWFESLDRGEEEDFFSSLDPEDQADLLERLGEKERRLWMRTLPPDDAADVLQQIEDDQLREDLKSYLSAQTLRETTALLAYAEDDAGGLMSPRFARLRPDMTVDEAITYLRRQMSSIELETLYYCYVLDTAQHLLGIASIADLFRCPATALISDIMEKDIVSVDEETDQETVAVLFAREDLIALPVLDENGVMMGIITIDDIVDVVQEEATEDFQKMGAVEALDTTYLQAGVTEMVRKRAGWLVILFFGSLITTKAMAAYEDLMLEAVVLTIFIPLIISTGGNSGSQAATLITRAMALGEVRLRDVLGVFRRELIVGSILGITLGIIGFGRVLLGQWFGMGYGEYYMTFAFAISLSIAACVLYGSLVGAMLPFLLKFFRVDPASASAPFVSTLVDATGIILYFTILQLVLSGTML